MPYCDRPQRQSPERRAFPLRRRCIPSRSRQLIVFGRSVRASPYTDFSITNEATTAHASASISRRPLGRTGQSKRRTCPPYLRKRRPGNGNMMFAQGLRLPRVQPASPGAVGRSVPAAASASKLPLPPWGCVMGRSDRSFMSVRDRFSQAADHHRPSALIAKR